MPKITDLTGATTLGYQDVFAVDQGANTKKATPRLITGVINAEWYGAVGDDSTDNAAALAAADTAAAALGGADILLPAGTFLHSGNFSLSEGNRMVGSGFGSHLKLSNGSFIIDAATANEVIERCALQNLSFSRVGSVGPVIDLISDNVAAANDFVANLALDKIWIRSSTGDGIRARGVVGLTLIDPFLDSCSGFSLRLEGNSVSTDFCNSIVLLRGNIIRNAKAVFADAAQSMTCLGTVFEGSTSAGLDLSHNIQNAQFVGCWFENNAAYDIRVGNDTSSGDSHGLLLNGCNFVDGAAAKTHAVELIIAHQVNIDNCRFDGYSTEAVKNNPFSTTAVDGHIGPHIYLLGGTPVSCSNETTYFYTDHRSRGAFTGTMTGVSGTVTGTIKWSRAGNAITMYIPQLQGTSNTTALTITGMPTSIAPTSQQYAPMRVIDNGGSAVWGIVRFETSGVLTLFPLASGGSWTASGTKGLSGAQTVTYLVN